MQPVRFVLVGFLALVGCGVEVQLEPTVGVGARAESGPNACGEVRTFKREFLCNYRRQRPDEGDDDTEKGETVRNMTVCSAVAGTQILNFYRPDIDESTELKTELHRGLNQGCSNEQCFDTGTCEEASYCCQIGYSSRFDDELRRFLTRHDPPPGRRQRWRVRTSEPKNAGQLWDWIRAEVDACRPPILHTSGHPSLYAGGEHSVVVVDYLDNVGTRWDFLIVSDNEEGKPNLRPIWCGSLDAPGVRTWLTTIRRWRQPAG